MKRILFFGGLWLTLVWGACSIPETESPAEAGLDLPLQTLAGDQVNLNDYGGQVIVINFWATWCGPCREEMPEFEAFYRDHQDDNFVLLAVNAGESANRAQGFVDEGGYTFPIMLDLDGSAADYFGGLRGMPTTFVIDQRGELVYQHFGPLDRAVLEAQVLPLLQ